MKKGFTLIELLVVVLIIGVLSAIALPQYKKAVLNSRMTQAIALFGTYKQAIDVWLMENGWPSAYTGLSGTKGAGVLGISTPLLSQQNTWYDYNEDLGMKTQAWCDTTYCAFSLTGYGEKGWLGRCGLQFQLETRGWCLAAITYGPAAADNALTGATKEQCPEVMQLACQYAKSNFSVYPASGYLSQQCATVGVTLGQ